jgi:hypothetical protein
MKTIAVVSIALLSFMKIQAQDQIKQGVYTLSGALSYYSMSYNTMGVDVTVSEITLNPYVSYFIVDQVELSFGVEYTRYSTTPSGSPSFKTTEPGLELGARYYFPCGKVAPFIGAFGQVRWTSFNGQSYSSPSTYYGFIGGLEVFISKAAAIEPSIGYSISHGINPSSENDFRIGIGVKYFIL